MLHFLDLDTFCTADIERQVANGARSFWEWLQQKKYISCNVQQQTERQIENGSRSPIDHSDNPHSAKGHPDGPHIVGKRTQITEQLMWGLSLISYQVNGDRYKLGLSCLNVWTSVVWKELPTTITHACINQYIVLRHLSQPQSVRIWLSDCCRSLTWF